MPRLPSRPLSSIIILFAPLLMSAQQPETKTVLDPVVVTAIRPLIKIAETPMIEPRFGAAVVAEGDYLYVIGGSNRSGIRLDTVERVDLRTGRATVWVKLKIARRHHRAVIAAGKIYVLGGTSGSADPTDPLSEEISDYMGDDPPLNQLYPPNLLARPENQLQ